ncbi:hypothetical protein [Segetibacter koreensis]|uniref:hypothetical protein n=1 Tax=Segetibacter koreensis TaxID=398037 RepID=UPI00037BEFEB|nr:hypothetical protein [Segetibacter koreensis]
MKSYSLLVIVLLLLTLGCKKELNTYPTSIEPNNLFLQKMTNYQRVTTIDGNVTKVGCNVTKLQSGEIYQICVPANWNGELILYAHGYVSPFLPLALPVEAAAYVPLFTSLGYAFATTSYSENGLAIQSGVDNMLNLRKKFIEEFGKPSKIYLTGGSEGGVVTTLAIERHPEFFSGGLPLCSHCGNFQKQIDYNGDFRVLFDYFFPGVLPGNVVNIPDQLIANWQTEYVPAILKAIRSNPAATLKVLNTAHAAYIPGNDSSMAVTTIGVLRYDVFATRDAIKKFGGQPYENINKIYFGSGSIWEDIKLNKRVKRFSADKTALRTIARYYETSGNIQLPLVSAHTTLDPIVPFWHLPLYEFKTILRGTNSLFTGIPVKAFGHCAFTEAEIVQGFGLLVQKVKGQTPPITKKLVDLSSTTNGKIIQSVGN